MGQIREENPLTNCQNELLFPMKTYKGKLGTYRLMFSSQSYFNEFALLSEQEKEPTWLEKLFPSLRKATTQWVNVEWGIHNFTEEFNQFVNASDEEKEQIIKDLISNYEEREVRLRKNREKLNNAIAQFS